MKMNRRHFVKLSCAACLGTSVMSGVLYSCQTTHYVSGTFESNGISVSSTEFRIIRESVTTYREYIILRNEKLEYPICLYRFSESEYAALLMKCTHQGTELQAAGDQLHCPAHGSEFNNRGHVTQGPAEDGLRTFPISVEQEKLLIHLS